MWPAIQSLVSASKWAAESNFNQNSSAAASGSQSPVPESGNWLLGHRPSRRTLRKSDLFAYLFRIKIYVSLNNSVVHN